MAVENKVVDYAVRVRVKQTGGLNEGNSFYSEGFVFKTDAARAKQLFQEGKVSLVDEEKRGRPHVEYR